MIQTLQFKEVSANGVANVEDDLIMGLIFGGVSLAHISVNPVWAESGGTYWLFNKLYKDFLEISTKNKLTISDELIQNIFAALGFKIFNDTCDYKRIYRSNSLDDVKAGIRYLEKNYSESKYFNMIVELSKDVYVYNLFKNAKRIKKLICKNGFLQSMNESFANSTSEIETSSLDDRNTFLIDAPLYFSNLGPI